MLLKFKTPVDAGEARLRFVDLDDRDPRVLVRCVNTGVAIAPCFTYAKDELVPACEPADLAREFSRILRSYLTAEEITEAIERNRTETHPHVCHSHDYCDANMAMYEAFKVVMGREIVMEENDAQEADFALWGAAWDIAKTTGFSVE